MATDWTWALIKITATSAHPVYNSKNVLIPRVGHTLWEESNSNQDGGRGSLQPNVYAYDFKTNLASIPILEATVEPIKIIDPPSQQVVLFGTIGGNRVFTSRSFRFVGVQTKKVPVFVSIPNVSKNPFSWNAEVVWGMEEGNPPSPVRGVTDYDTILELYWIATTLHTAFQGGIPIEFLRRVLGRAPSAPVNATFYQDMTRQVFSNFNKRYDTVQGNTSHFFIPMAVGGNFSLKRYLAMSDNDRKVTCVDQAAMLELCCSLQGGTQATTFLIQNPYGFINDTHLAGVKDKQGVLINVNNPFFERNPLKPTSPSIRKNDPLRTFFGTHVFNGQHRQDGSWNIYDATSGPAIGPNIQQYYTTAIDYDPEPYKRHQGFRPGRPDEAKMDAGVIGIDGKNPGLQVQRTMAPLMRSLKGAPTLIANPPSPLLNTVVAHADTVTHVDWARLPTWLRATLGDTWDVDDGWLTASEAETQAFWYISDRANSADSSISVHIVVISALTPDGHVDTEESAAIVRDRIHGIQRYTQRDDVWTTRTLPCLEEASLQYADDSGAGRVIVVAGSVCMDIKGMTSGSALMPHALMLLNRTVRHNRPPPVVPVIQRRAIQIGSTTLEGPEAETNVITVTGIDTRFSVVFWVGCEIAVAGAASDTSEVLFDRHIVNELGSGKGRTVEFFFIVQGVGCHRVHMYVAELETMVQAKSALEVEVVDG